MGSPGEAQTWGPTSEECSCHLSSGDGGVGRGMNSVDDVLNQCLGQSSRIVQGSATLRFWRQSLLGK